MVLLDCLSGLTIDAEPSGPGGQAEARWGQDCPVAAGRWQNVEDEFLFPAGSSPAGRKELHPDRSWPAGRMEPSLLGSVP